MTAEIIILNKHGIALAADSAVSIGSPEDTRKIYNSANKLFMLSKRHPVAIMVYGSGSFVGVPWEIVVKEYRSFLGNESFPTLLNYSENFWQFITQNRRLFSIPEERWHVEQKIRTQLLRLCEQTRRTTHENFVEYHDVSNEEYESVFIEILGTYINATNEHLSSRRNLENFTEDDGNLLLDNYAAFIEESYSNIFEKIYPKLPAHLKEGLQDLLKQAFLKESFDHASGIVIAGYGKDDIYPQVASYQVGIMLNGKPRVMPLRQTSTVYNDVFQSAIIPYAQDEVVHTFLTGMDPVIRETFEKSRNELVESVTKRIPADVFRADLEEESARARVRQSIEEVMHEFADLIERAKHEIVLNPILDMLEYLPKDELAEMAETLVNLTAFKRKMSNSLESVGGPIDVAIISKGDGFIWYKRKHYFNPEFNQHFFSNYYNDIPEEV